MRIQRKILQKILIRDRERNAMWHLEHSLALWPLAENESMAKYTRFLFCSTELSQSAYILDDHSSLVPTTAEGCSCRSLRLQRKKRESDGTNRCSSPRHEARPLVVHAVLIFRLLHPIFSTLMQIRGVTLNV